MDINEYNELEFEEWEYFDGKDWKPCKMVNEEYSMNHSAIITPSGGRIAIPRHMGGLRKKAE